MSVSDKGKETLIYVATDQPMLVILLYITDNQIIQNEMTKSCVGCYYVCI